MWLDYVKQKEEGKGLEYFRGGGGGGGGVMDVWSRKNRGNTKCKRAGSVALLARTHTRCSR